MAKKKKRKEELVLNPKVQQKAMMLAYSFMQRLYRRLFVDSYKDLKPPKVYLCLKREALNSNPCETDCHQTGCYWRYDIKEVRAPKVLIYRYSTQKLNTLIHEYVHHIQAMFGINENSGRSEKAAWRAAKLATSYLEKYTRRIAKGG